MRRPSGFFILAFALALYFLGGLGTFFLALVFAVAFAASFRWIPKRFFVNPVTPNSFVLLTGASRGIGKEAALYLASRGYGVFAGVRKQADADALLASATGKSKDLIKPIIIDISSDDSVKTAIDNIKAQLDKSGGKLIGFVQNAAVLTAGALEVKPLEIIRSQFETNVFGSVRVVKQILPLLRQSPGKSRVILVGSTASYFDAFYCGMYKSSKMALEGVCDELRNQVRHFGISVTYLAPGTYTTDMVNLIDSEPARYAEIAEQQSGLSGAAADDLRSVFQYYTKEANRMNFWFGMPSPQPCRWVAEEIEFILRAWTFWVPSQRIVGMDVDLATAPLHWWLPDYIYDIATSVVVGSAITPTVHTILGFPAKKWAEMFPKSTVPESN